MRLTLLALLTTTCLAACQTERTDYGALAIGVGQVLDRPAVAPVKAARPTCPALVTYTTAEQGRAAAELAGMPAESMMRRFSTDYGRVRDWTRACEARR